MKSLHYFEFFAHQHFIICLMSELQQKKSFYKLLCKHCQWHSRKSRQSSVIVMREFTMCTIESSWWQWSPRIFSLKCDNHWNEFPQQSHRGLKRYLIKFKAWFFILSYRKWTIFAHEYIFLGIVVKCWLLFFNKSLIFKIPKFKIFREVFISQISANF